MFRGRQVLKLLLQESVDLVVVDLQILGEPLQGHQLLLLLLFLLHESVVFLLHSMDRILQCLYLSFALRNLRAQGFHLFIPLFNFALFLLYDLILLEDDFGLALDILGQLTHLVLQLFLLLLPLGLLHLHCQLDLLERLLSLAHIPEDLLSIDQVEHQQFEVLHLRVLVVL